VNLTVIAAKRASKDPASQELIELQVLASRTTGSQVPAKVSVKAGLRYELIDSTTGKVVAGQRLVRRGKSLDVYVQDERVLELENFYEAAASEQLPAQYLAAQEGAAQSLVLLDGGAMPASTPVSSTQYQALSPSSLPGIDESVVALAPVAAAAFGGGAALGGAAAAAAAVMIAGEGGAGGIDAYSAAATKIAGYAQDDGVAAAMDSSKTPVLADYTALGVTGIGGTGQPTVAMINSALAGADITGALANDRTKVQTIVDAYAAIVQSADGVANNDSDNPTQAQYVAVGVNGVDTADEAGLLGSVIDGKAAGDVDTVAKLQRLADAVQNVMDGDASKADLERLGITGVTDENLKAVQDKLAATADGDLNTQAQLQSAVKAAADAYSAASSKLAAYAQDDGAAAAADSSKTPELADYTALGVTGIDGTDQPTVAMINSALADADIDGTEANDRSEVQAIVNAYKAILDNANSASASDATQTQYAAVGLNGVDTADEAGLLGSVIDTKADTDVDTVVKLQQLADAVQAVMEGDASKADLERLGITGVTDENLKAVQDKLAATADGDLNTQAQLQSAVKAAADAYSAASSKLAAYAQDDGAAAAADSSKTPELADYTALGVTGIDGTDQPTVAMINSALADADIDGTEANDRSEVQAIVNAYKAILDNANSASASDATQTQYAAVGLNGVDTADEAGLLGSVIDTKADTDVDTVVKLQQLADAVQAVMEGDASKADLERLGITGVTDENLKAVQDKLAATADGDLNTQAQLQSAVKAAADAYSAASSKLAAYAQDDGAAAAADSSKTPELADYTALGVTGIDGTDQPTVAMINSALADADIDGTEANDRSEVQAIVNAYKAILDNANSASASDATQTQYAAVGLNGVDTADEAGLLGSVIDTKADTDVDTVVKLQQLADAVQAVMEGDASKADLERLGITGVTDENLKAVQDKLAATADGDLNTQAQLQSAVKAAADAYSAASSKLAAYAQDDGAAAAADSSKTPELADYTALGVTGIGEANEPTLAMINSALADADIDGTEANDRSEVQAIVNAYKAILDNANSASASDATQTQYAAVGVSGVDTADEAGLLGSVIDTKADTDVDTVVKLQQLADAVQSVMDGDASLAELQSLGITGVTAENLAAVRAALLAATDATQLNTLTGAQGVVTGAVNAYNTAATKIAAYAQDNGADLSANPAPVLADYTALAVTGLNGPAQPTVAMVNSALADADITGALVNDRTKVKTIVDAYAAIVQSADGVANNDAVNPTQAQYAAIGVNGVNTAEEEGLLGDVLDTASRNGAATDASAVDSVTKLQALADAVQSVMDGDASLAELQSLGITGVTAENLAAVQAALLAATDATQLNTLTGAQGVVTGAVNAYNTAATKIAAYAQDNGADLSANPAPVLADYTALAVTGLNGPAQPTVAMVNSALADADITGALVNDRTKVKTIVDAYAAIVQSADGVANNDAVNPTQAQYAAIGVNGVNTAEEEGLLGDVLDTASRNGAATDASAVDSVTKLQALADAVQSVMDGDASLAELQSLGITGVTAENLAAVRAALLAANDATQLNTLTGAQGVVTGAVNAYNTAATKIAAYAQDNGADLSANPAPVLADYTALAVTGLNGPAQPTVAMVNSALADADITGALVNDRTKVKTIVDAYAAIVQSADGVANNDAVNPTQAQYAAIGVNGVNTAEEEGLLGDVLDTASRNGAATDASAVDSVTKLQALADAVQSVMDGDASLAELQSLGITGVTAENLAAVQAALLAATDATQLNTLTGAQGVVTGAVNAYNTAATKIAAYAQDNGADLSANPAPVLADYTALAVTGLNGPAQPTVAMVNSALADADITGALANDRTKVKTIVDAYAAIVQSADGVANNDAVNPTQAQYAAIGVNGVNTAEEEGLLGDVLDTASRNGAATDASAVDSVTKLQALADAVQSVMDGDASLAELQSLGITGVTAENLAAVQAALLAATDATQLNTLTGAQGVVTGAVNAYNTAATKIAAYAQDNGADLSANPAPVLADYTALAVTGLNGPAQPTVAMINSALADADITGALVNDRTKVKTIVDAYAAIVQSADGVANNDAVNPTQAQYAAIGVNGVNTAEEEGLLGDVLDTASRNGAATDASAVDSVTKLQALADAVQSVMDGDASLAELQSLGITGVTAENLAAVQAALLAATDATQLNTLTGAQGVVTGAVNAYNTAATKIAAYAQDNGADLSANPAPVLADYTALAVTGLNGPAQPTVAMVNSALADADITGALVNDRTKVKTIVDAYAAIVQSADGVANNDAVNPTQAQYAAIGVNGVNTAEEEGLLGDVLDTASRNGAATDASAVDSVTKLQALADAVQSVMDGDASLAELQSLGITGVTAENLAAVRAALLAANDATQLNTLTGAQGVVTGAVNAYNTAATKIAAYAQDNGADLSANPAPVLADYTALAVTGLNGPAQPTVAMVNSALADADITGALVNDRTKVKTIVDAYAAIVQSADGVANNDAVNPTQAKSKPSSTPTTRSWPKPTTPTPTRATAWPMPHRAATHWPATTRP
jgi:hypothetical protein